MNKISIVDIDGTMTIVGDRLKHITNGNKDYEKFYNACDEDAPNWPIVNLVNNIAMNHEIVFVTGRRGSLIVREKTFQWLKSFCKFPITHENLVMREDSDRRHDIEVKPILLNKWLIDNDRKSSEIDFILEDRNSMTAKWRDLGYTTLQVADGDF